MDTDATPEYVSWTEVEIRVYTPYAREMGVPVDYVTIPTIAARTLEDLLDCASLVGYLYVAAAQVRIRAAAKKLRTYQGPLVRFVCPECGDSWDAWVGEDGHLQDQRDQFCSGAHAPTAGVEVTPT